MNSTPLQLITVEAAIDIAHISGLRETLCFHCLSGFENRAFPVDRGSRRSFGHASDEMLGFSEDASHEALERSRLAVDAGVGTDSRRSKNRIIGWAKQGHRFMKELTMSIRGILKSMLSTRDSVGSVRPPSSHIATDDSAMEPECELLTIDEPRPALDVADDSDMKSIASISESDERGFIARHRATGAFKNRTRAGLTELKTQNGICTSNATNGAGAAARTDDIQWLSLGSTQVLKRMLVADTDGETE